MKTVNFELLQKLAGMINGVVNAHVNQPMSCDQLADSERCAHAVITVGIPFTGTRSEVAELRQLVDAGYVSAAGHTQGRDYRLTEKGWLTVCLQTAVFASPEMLRRRLERLAVLQEKTSIHLPGRPSDKLVMVWHLLPDAGEWLTAARKSDEAWRAYQKNHANLQPWLTPLLALGWAYRDVDTRQQVWALRVTEAGRAALANWNKAEGLPEVDEDQIERLWEAQEEGYQIGAQMAKRRPPPEMANVVPRFLPASAWM